MDIEKMNWIASSDAISQVEKEELFDWLEKNAEKTVENGVTKYTVPILEIKSDY